MNKVFRVRICPDLRSYMTADAVAQEGTESCAERETMVSDEAQLACNELEQSKSQPQDKEEKKDLITAA